MRLFICILLFTILLCSAVYASDMQQTQFFFVKKDMVVDSPKGSCIVLFSDIEFTNECKNDIVIVGGSVKFSGKISSNVYALFSNIEYSQENVNIFHINSRLLLIFTISLLQCLLSVAVLFTNIRKCTQSATVAEKEFTKVALSGIYIFIALLSLIIIFILSVAGIPIAAVCFLLALVLIFLGQIPLSIAVGFLLNRYFDKQLHLFTYFITGYVAVEVFKYIPVVGWLFGFVIIPVFSFGILARTFINTYILKQYYTTRFYEPLKIDSTKSKPAGYDILHKKT